MKGIPICERPRERLRRLGHGALRSDELLAILLGSGSKKDPVMQLSKELIARFGSVEGLSQATLEELQGVSGIGLAKALKIKAAFALSSRKDPLIENNTIRTPQEAFNAARPYIQNEKREHFLAILLDVRSRLISVEIISVGTLTATLVHPREVFFPAIRKKAHSLIVVHNHPSDNLTPSEEDILITKQLHEASKLMNIPLIDHLIIGRHNYYSFKENGFSFKTG